MNIRQLTDKLLDKWLPKIICFLIAIILYLFFQVTLVEKKTFIVPLNVDDQGMVTSLSKLPASVSVIVRAKSDVLNSISASDFSARLMLIEYTESGKYEIPVSINLSDKLLETDPLEVRVKPEYITADLERKVAKFVRVVPSIAGEVAHGYEISEINVVPSYAEIIGPESHVRKIDYIDSTKVIVSNANTGFSAEAEYLPVNNIINVVDKGPYKVTVSVNQIVTDRLFTDIGILLYNLNSGLKVQGEMNKVSVRLSGTLLNLERFSPALNLASVDLSAIKEPGEYELPVVYEVPANYSLVNVSDEVIKIKIEKNPEQPEKTEENSFDSINYSVLEGTV